MIKNIRTYKHVFDNDGITFEIELCYGEIDGYKVIHNGNVLPQKSTEILCESKYYWEIIQEEINKLLEETANARY
jgi:hypothetical protein